MRNYTKVTPEGTKDILFSECKFRRYIERKLSKNFTLRGYDEVITPGMEYYDVFQIPTVSVPQEEMYKATDNNGKLIVFRPDSTLSIARMVSTRLQNAQKPIRLFYNQTIYRNSPDHLGRLKERPQMGVEILGVGGISDDLEAILLAADSLSMFVPDFRLEIGNAVFFNTLIEKLDISEVKKESIRSSIESKNYAALDIQLDDLPQGATVNAIRSLPRLFGGEEVFAEAEKFSIDNKISEMLEYTKKLYKSLSKTSLKDKIIVDLGLVQSNDYYTGIIFSAYTQEHGDAILSGGRYDSLLEKFETSMPAIGFSLDTGTLTDIKLKFDDEDNLENKTLIHAMPGYEVFAYDELDRYVKNNNYCELSLFDDLSKSKEYAVSDNFDLLVVIGDKKQEILLKEGK